MRLSWRSLVKRRLRGAVARRTDRRSFRRSRTHGREQPRARHPTLDAELVDGGARPWCIELLTSFGRSDCSSEEPPRAERLDHVVDLAGHEGITTNDDLEALGSEQIRDERRHRAAYVLAIERCVKDAVAA